MDFTDKTDKDIRQLLKRLLSDRLVEAGFDKKGGKFCVQTDKMLVIVNVEKRTWSPSISFDYQLRWIGQEISELDPNFDFHIFAQAGSLSRREQEADRSLDGKICFEPGERQNALDEFLREDREQLIRVGENQDSFLAVFVDGLMNPAQLLFRCRKHGTAVSD